MDRSTLYFQAWAITYEREKLKAVIESGGLFSEEAMPGGGRHRFVFVDKPPFVFRVVFVLLFANTFLMLLLANGAKHFLSKASINLPPCEAFAERGVQYHAPEIVCWYESRSIAIQFILLALLAAIFIIFRKRLRRIE
jgi:hypothetical protein